MHAHAQRAACHARPPLGPLCDCEADPLAPLEPLEPWEPSGALGALGALCAPLEPLVTRGGA